ncbi:MAG: M90 family metallopeptidase [Pseudomonadota bacterium]
MAGYHIVIRPPSGPDSFQGIATMSWSLKNWHKTRILQQEGIPDSIWQKLIDMRCLKGLNPEELLRLRDYATLFLHDKQIYGAHELEITDEMRVTIALQACILILNLDLDYYQNWSQIIVYPGEFILDYDYADEFGIVHHVHRAASGEAWSAGPVILSWQDAAGTASHPGHNVVIHEFAHKIDMRHEGANGCPELHANMSAYTWHEVFSQAYAKFCHQVDREQETIIDPYAAESPAEFFAVLSEVFFELPLITRQHFPSVYEQLALFYRQDPAQRWR